MASVRLAALAGAALILGAQAAGAADPPPIMQNAPPPVVEFGGWYLRGDIGFRNERLRSHVFDPAPPPPPEPLFPLVRKG